MSYQVWNLIVAQGAKFMKCSQATQHAVTHQLLAKGRHFIQCHLPRSFLYTHSLKCKKKFWYFQKETRKVKEEILLGWGVQPNESKGHMCHQNTEGNKDLIIYLLAVIYHFSFSRDSIGIFFFSNSNKNLFWEQNKKVLWLVTGKNTIICSISEEVTCFLGKITEQGRNHSKGTLIYECLETHWENLIPYNCCAEAKRQPFNLWTATATQPKKASMWSLEMMEVRVGKDLFF